MFQGSCCCGRVKFAISEKPKLLAACHCSRCRKLGATPFAFVDASSFQLLAGRDRISVYRPEPPFKYPRCFCASCGTSLGEILSAERSFPVPLNCFDDDLGMPIRFNEHVATKPSWLVIPEGVEQFAGDPA